MSVPEDQDQTPTTRRTTIASDKWTLASSILPVVGVVVSLAAWLIPGRGGTPPINIPSVSASATPSSTGTTSTYLTSLQRTNVDNPFVTIGSAAVDGAIYQDSVLLQVVDATDTAFAEYDLGSRFQRLTATIGLSDTSLVTKVDVVLTVDGINVSSFGVSIGQAQRVSVSVAGGLRLRILARIVENTATASCCVEVVVGSPLLLGA